MNSSYNVGIPQLRRIHQFAFAFEFEFIKRKPRRRFAFAFKVPGLVSSIRFLSAAQAFLFLASHDTSDQRAQDFVEWFRLLRIPSPHAHFQSRDTQSQRVGFLVDSLIQVTATCGHGRWQVRTFPSAKSRAFAWLFRFAPHVDQVNLGYLIHNYLHAVNSWDERCSGMDLSIAHVTSDKLPEYCWQADTTGNPNHDGAEDWSLACVPSSSGAVAPQPQPAVGVENNPNHNHPQPAVGSRVE
jgi:hypothetical protein